MDSRLMPASEGDVEETGTWDMGDGDCSRALCVGGRGSVPDKASCDNSVVSGSGLFVKAGSSTSDSVLNISTVSGESTSPVGSNTGPVNLDVVWIVS